MINVPLHRAARYRSESQRPDLWPDYSWNPTMGVTGSMLLDIPSGKNMTIVGGMWQASPHGTVIQFSGGNYYASNNTIGPMIFPVTISFKFKSLDNNPSAVGYLFWWGDSSNDADYYSIDVQTNGTLASWMRDVGARGYTAADYCDGLWHTCTTIIYYTDRVFYDTYVDGYLVISNSGTAGDTGSAENFDLIAIGMARDASPTNPSNAQFANVSIYDKILTLQQIQDLHRDPLLPFRRKTMISLYVPSGAPPATSIPVIMNYYRRLRTA